MPVIINVVEHVCPLPNRSTTIHDFKFQINRPLTEVISGSFSFREVKATLSDALKNIGGISNIRIEQDHEVALVAAHVDRRHTIKYIRVLDCIKDVLIPRPQEVLSTWRSIECTTFSAAKR